jgi:ATP adenylyltransferase
MALEPRFSTLFSESADRPIWDTVVARVGQFAVAPTKGSIVPGWLLVVPEAEVLNFATLGAGGDNPLTTLKAVASQLRVPFSEVIWFEHGACSPGTTIGCGVDHAHLHLLVAPPFTIDQFRQEVQARANAEWSHIETDRAYEAIDGVESYYVFGDGRDAWFTTGVNFGSQFFRKIVAEVVGLPDEWDYNAHSGTVRVTETLTQLSQVQAEAA